MSLNISHRIFLEICLLAAYRAFVQPLVRSIPRRVLSSIENGIHLEDALGRQFVLPIDCVKTWEVSSFIRCLGADL